MLRARLRRASRGTRRVASILTMGAALVSIRTAQSGAAPKAPDWLVQAAASKTDFGYPGASAVVLLDEQATTIELDGTLSGARRYAVKILRAEGRARAIGAVSYLTGSGKVRSIHGWVIRSSGAVETFGGDHALDAAAESDVYNYRRFKSIVATDRVEPGAVFGFEAQVEEREILKEFEWVFEGDLPVVRSRFTLTAPDGWTPRVFTFNHEDIPARVSGSSRTWELTELPGLPEERDAPPGSATAPRLAVSVVPPGGDRPGSRAFESWETLARWLSDLTDDTGSVTPALAERAKALAGGQTGEAAVARAIGSYVAGVNYISIQLGVARGGGFRPHTAGEVLAKGYGDCKDKANLMRALLSAAGIRSMLVLVHYGDRSYVRDAWPAASQFNHCIVAIQTRDPNAAPALDHPTLGRLLFFDPTNPFTPMGDLPKSEQGSLALLVTREAGPLVRIPRMPSDTNDARRDAEFALAPDGSIHAVLRERSTGQAAASERQLFRSRTRTQYADFIQSWVAGGAVQAKVSRVDAEDGFDQGTFGLTVEFAAPKYARLAGNLMLFRPVVLDRWDWVWLTGSERYRPVLLEERTFQETSRFSLPDRFEVEELPDPVRLETPFGSYESKIEREASGSLLIRRTITFRAATIPVSEYASIRAFYEKLRAAEQGLVVLAKR